MNGSPFDDHARSNRHPTALNSPQQSFYGSSPKLRTRIGHRDVSAFSLAIAVNIAIKAPRRYKTMRRVAN
jgi:hypothetical protein